MIRKGIFMMRVHWNRVKTKRQSLTLTCALGSANRLIWSPGMKWLHLEVYFNSFDMNEQAFLWYLGWKASQPKRTVQNNGLRPLFRPYVIYLKMLGPYTLNDCECDVGSCQFSNGWSTNDSSLSVWTDPKSFVKEIIKLMRRVQNN